VLDEFEDVFFDWAIINFFKFSFALKGYSLICDIIILESLHLLLLFSEPACYEIMQ